MRITELQDTIRDFWELPRSRAELLLGLPEFLERHFDAIGIVSGIVNGRLSVLSATDARFLAAGAELPGQAELEQAAAQRMITVQCELTDAPAEVRFMVGGIVRERGHVIATLQLHRRRPFSANSSDLLAVFTRLLSARLSDTSSNLEATVMAELMTGLMSASSIADGARRALDVLVRYNNAEVGVILQARRSVMEAIASHGFSAAADRAVQLGIGQPYPNGLAWEACLTGETLSLPVEDDSGDPGDVTTIQPLGWRGAWRRALVLRMKKQLVYTPADQMMNESIATQLHLAFDRLQWEYVQDQLLSLQMEVVDADASGMYQKILDAAVELVPGAMTGSLLVRSSPSQPFRFRATSGYPLSGFRDTQLSEANMLRWYGRGMESFRAGEPRSIRLTEAIKKASRRGARGEEPILGVDEILSTVCLPVAYRGDVLALINLDNQLDDDAFAEDSARVLRLFGPVVGSMLAAARQREQVISMAHSDPLTGLANRRGADLALASQLRHAEQHNEPFVLLTLDLTRFKDINDRYGHDAGDQALVTVARTLQANARAGDTIARWGGDEFSVLLPATNRETGELIASRLRSAIAGLGAGEVRLGADIGLAVWPDDADSATRLLQIADDRMYAGKLAGRSQRRDD